MSKTMIKEIKIAHIVIYDEHDNYIQNHYEALVILQSGESYYRDFESYDELIKFINSHKGEMEYRLTQVEN